MIIKPKTMLYKELITSIVQAEGAASQLVHAVGNPVGFMKMRDTLSAVKDAVIRSAPQNAYLKPQTLYTEH